MCLPAIMLLFLFGRKADFPPPQEKTAWLQHLKAHDKRNPHPQAAEESLSLCAADEWVTLRERCSILDSNGENLTKPS